MAQHALIISSPHTHPAHTPFTKDLVAALYLQNIIGEVYAIDDAKPLHEHFYAITSHPADFLITLDLAGFEMKTDGGRIGYNLIPCRIANLLLRPLTEYSGELLGMPINFSMFFYTALEDEVSLYQETYPLLPHIDHSHHFTWKNELCVNSEFIPKLLSDLELA